MGLEPGGQMLGKLFTEKKIVQNSFSRNLILQVCDEVTEIVCEVVPYTDCQMIMENTPYKSFKMVEKPYDKIECEEGMKSVPHQKMMPECRNVTKQNCVTKWETDENGNQVQRRILDYFNLFASFRQASVFLVALGFGAKLG